MSPSGACSRLAASQRIRGCPSQKWPPRRATRANRTWAPASGGRWTRHRPNGVWAPAGPAFRAPAKAPPDRGGPSRRLPTSSVGRQAQEHFAHTGEGPILCALTSLLALGFAHAKVREAPLEDDPVGATELRLVQRELQHRDTQFLFPQQDDRKHTQRADAAHRRRNIVDLLTTDQCIATDQHRLEVLPCGIERCGHGKQALADFML